MEMERFGRWSVVALVAFGVMLVAAGFLGTLKMAPCGDDGVEEDGTVEWKRSARRTRSSSPESGWGETEGLSGSLRANGAGAGTVESSKKAEAGVGWPFGTPERTTGGAASPHERQSTFSSAVASNATTTAHCGEPSGGHPPTQANGPTNRTARATPSQRTGEVATVAGTTPGGGHVRPSERGGETRGEMASSGSISNRAGGLVRVGQADVGWGDTGGGAEGEEDDKEEEEEEGD